MVTESPVYHWTIADTTSPCQNNFDQHTKFSGAQATNYQVVSNEKWLVLIEISGNSANSSAFKAKDAMQLCSGDHTVARLSRGVQGICKDKSRWSAEIYHAIHIGFTRLRFMSS